MPWNVSEAYIVSGKTENSSQVEINYGNKRKKLVQATHTPVQT